MSRYAGAPLDTSVLSSRYPPAVLRADELDIQADEAGSGPCSTSSWLCHEDTRGAEMVELLLERTLSECELAPTDQDSLQRLVTWSTSASSNMESAEMINKEGADYSGTANCRGRKKPTIQEENDVVWAGLVDLLLLAGFVLQHSMGKAPLLRGALSALKLQVLERSLYVLASSLALLVLMSWWQHTPHHVMWNVDEGRQLGMVRAALHAYAWVVIYFGCFVFDIADLLGVKQVYYDLCQLDEPAQYRSRGLCRFLSHGRHPSFSAFCLVFWLQSSMSLDRLLLAVYMTGYMAYSWNIDQEDYNYHKAMVKRKEQEISSYLSH